jgi:hypothetical protein
VTVAAGPWLRLTALWAAAGTLLAVVSGSLGLGAAHRLLAALALPPLAALVAAAWVAHRRLLGPSLAALVLFGAAALVTGSTHCTSRSRRRRSQRRWSPLLRGCAASRSRADPGATTSS